MVDSVWETWQHTLVVTILLFRLVGKMGPVNLAETKFAN